MAFKKILTFEEIRKIADEEREMYWSNKPVPIGIEAIVELGHNIHIVPVKDLRNTHELEGFLTKDRSSIYIDHMLMMDEKYLNRYRFTLAHELGHYLLHKEFYNEISYNSVEEWAKIRSSMDQVELSWFEKHADEFAGRLLVPVEDLTGQIDSIQKTLDDKAEVLKNEGMDRKEINEYLTSVVSAKFCREYGVAQRTLQIRLEKEKIKLT